MSNPSPRSFFPTAPWLADPQAIASASLAEPFDGYPYLATKIGCWALCHIAVLPTDWSRARLLRLAERQAVANQLETYLCLCRGDVIRLDPSGVASVAELVPTGIPAVERLVLAEPVPASPEVIIRRKSLEAYHKRLTPPKTFLVGDGLEPGRPAQPGEVSRLERCGACGSLRGEYLARKGEGNGDLTPRIIQVHCICENHNLCAGCGQPLSHRRLSSYYFDERAGSVIYLAAYNGFSHRCP